jgi:hypothetical protein
MRPHTCLQRARGVRRVIPWLGILGLLLTASLAWTAAVGEPMVLQARNRAGVPFHQEPRGTREFPRVPDGTKATVLGVAPDGRWLKLSLPDADLLLGGGPGGGAGSQQSSEPHQARRAPGVVYAGGHPASPAGARVRGKLRATRGRVRLRPPLSSRPRLAPAGRCQRSCPPGVLERQVHTSTLGMARPIKEGVEAGTPGVPPMARPLSEPALGLRGIGGPVVEWE